METFNSFIEKVQTNLIDPAITLLSLAAFILFAVGVIEMIRNGENEEKRKQGQQHMIWGIIGLTIMFGAATIVQILKKVVTS